MKPIFDARDAALRDERLAVWNAVQGPRVGDWVIMPDGAELRFTHDWGDEIQTTCRHLRQDASFYFYGDCMSFSGSLDPAIPKADLVDTGETRNGRTWFFHHNEARAYNGVHFEVPCRVFRYQPNGGAR